MFNFPHYELFLNSYTENMRYNPACTQIPALQL